MAIWTNFEVDIYTPTVSNVTISIPGDLVEINAGGIQVVRNDTRYVRINKSGTSDTMLTVGGDITATGEITAYASDERLKENIEEVDNAIIKIEKLKPVFYTFNERANKLAGFNTSSKHIGLFAQDVQSVLPEVVTLAPFDTIDVTENEKVSKSGENYLTIKYEKIVPLLVQAIKEQQKVINHLSSSLVEIMKKVL